MALAQGFITAVDVEQTADNFKICLRHRDQGLGGATGGGSAGGGSSLSISCRNVDGVALADPAVEGGGGLDADCNMGCINSAPEVNLVVSGGLSPYTWSAVSAGGGTAPTVATSGSGDRNAKITPPSSTTVAGVAFEKSWGNCNTLGATRCIGGGSNASTSNRKYGCEGEVEASCNANGMNTGATLCGTQAYTGCMGTREYCMTTELGPGFCEENNDLDLKFTCDSRTQSMIDSGCLPCEGAMHGAVVTVTDSLGVSISITLGAGAQVAA